MNLFYILAVTITLTTTLVPCFAGVIIPTQVQSQHHVLGKLNAVARQSSCDSKADCDSGQSCITLEGVCETSACDGFCLEIIRCSCSDPCEGETTCITIGQTDGLFLTTCVSDFFIDALGDFARPSMPCDEEPNNSEGENGSEESNSPDDGAEDSEPSIEPDEEEGDPVCIGVDLLQDFASHQLVFEKHTLARVLCDSSISCATRGHMVNYRGKVMMMGTYCNIVGCEQKVMKVNSPKYERGLKVASRTPNMHFTAFAARYGTNAEEAVLAAAVRVGL